MAYYTWSCIACHSKHIPGLALECTYYTQTWDVYTVYCKYLTRGNTKYSLKYSLLQEWHNIPLVSATTKTQSPETNKPPNSVNISAAKELNNGFEGFCCSLELRYWWNEKISVGSVAYDTLLLIWHSHRSSINTEPRKISETNTCSIRTAKQHLMTCRMAS